MLKISVKEIINGVPLHELFFYFTNFLLQIKAFLVTYFRAVVLALKLPGPRSIPLIGNVLLIKDKDLLTKAANQLDTISNSVISCWVSVFPVFIILDPEVIQTILLSKKHTEKSFIYKLLHNFLGEGLISNSQEKWSTHRKIMQPAFHSSILENFVPLFAECATVNLRKTNINDKINIGHFVNDVVFNIVNCTVLGIPIADKNHSQILAFRQGELTATYRITHPWLLLESLYKITQTSKSELHHKNVLQNIVKELIHKRKQLKDLDYKCFLDYLIQISRKNSWFTEEDIINEACTLMLAGQDSVGSTTAICIFLLAQNLDCQKKCIEEIDSIFDNDDRAPTKSDLRDMNYLELCIKETLRMYPSIPAFSRKISEDIKVDNDILPAGANVLIVPYAIHNHPKIYPDPEKFIPERFLPENTKARHPFSYIPFSAGPRNCIGHRFAMLQMKTVISGLLRNFEILPVSGKTTFKPFFKVTLRASGGLWVYLKHRT